MTHTALPLLSATQINLYRECPRKYGFQYILKIKRPKTAAQELGDAVDGGQLQPYLTQGRPLDDNEAGRIAACAVPHLPAPMTDGLQCQKHFVFNSFTGLFAYQGYLDLWLPKQQPYPRVTDFKTTKNFSYRKTPEKLKTDVQAQLYATWAISETDTEVVDLQWITMLTVPREDGTYPPAKPSVQPVTAEHVAGQFEAIEATGERVFNTLKASPASADDRLAYVLSLPPETSMCDAFGGCPYRPQCNPNNQQYRDSTIARLRKKQGDENMTSQNEALARLKARKAGVAPPAVEAPPSFAGINPPEKDLPPAPPTGVAADIEAPSVDASPVVLEKKPRAKRTTKDPLGADAGAYTAPEVTASIVNISNNATIEDRLTTALRAAAKAFLESLS